MANNDPMADLVANWRQATDAYVKLWQQTVEQLGAMPAFAEAQREAAATALGTQDTLHNVTREAFEPLIELSGAVPQGEFRRLADDVHTILLRLDTIDDALGRIQQRIARLEAAAPEQESS